MEYTEANGEISLKNPEITISYLSITQENTPGMLQDGSYAGPFKFKFQCRIKNRSGLRSICEFYFYQREPIAPGSYTRIEAVEKWLLPALN